MQSAFSLPPTPTLWHALLHAVCTHNHQEPYIISHQVEFILIFCCILLALCVFHATVSAQMNRRTMISACIIRFCLLLLSLCLLLNNCNWFRYVLWYLCVYTHCLHFFSSPVVLTVPLPQFQMKSHYAKSMCMYYVLRYVCVCLHPVLPQHVGRVFILIMQGLICHSILILKSASMYLYVNTWARTHTFLHKTD